MNLPIAIGSSWGITHLLLPRSAGQRASTGGSSKRPISGGLSKLRNRLQALRDESGGSFSSSGSAAGGFGQSGFGSPITSEISLADADPAPPSPTSNWTISALGSAEKAAPPAAAPPPPLALPTEPAVPSPKPPRRSRLDASPGPRTPPRRPAAPSPLRPRSPSHSLPVSAIGCDEQLGALDRLCKQLSQVAAALTPEDEGEASPPRQVERSMGSHTLRSSTDHWKEYHDLAAQLEHAQELLKQLEESDA